MEHLGVDSFRLTRIRSLLECKSLEWSRQSFALPFPFLKVLHLVRADYYKPSPTFLACEIRVSHSVLPEHILVGHLHERINMSLVFWLKYSWRCHERNWVGAGLDEPCKLMLHWRGWNTVSLVTMRATIRCILKRLWSKCNKDRVKHLISQSGLKLI